MSLVGIFNKLPHINANPGDFFSKTEAVNCVHTEFLLEGEGADCEAIYIFYV
jgi:hypothetical protein